MTAYNDRSADAAPAVPPLTLPVRSAMPRLAALLALALALACLAAGATRAAELGVVVQQHIRAATFEVVQLKPPDGEVKYERPLPMDLMPFQERTDKYRSIGTAFAVAPNRYVTAGHVIQIGLHSQFGPPALRDAAGKVYDIDQVYKYSEREDFVEFSLRDPPAGVQTLGIGPQPSLNDAVFAVGNALGEGVVFRDGLYTSETPEEQDGEWKWLRFSAAASPGNSGGPLVDAQGRVIGVVLRKSPSENLNYALSMEQVQGAPENQGVIAARSSFRLPLLDAAETVNVDQRFALPVPLQKFYDTTSGIAKQALLGAATQLLQNNSARLFPHGQGSERVLHSIERAPNPVVLREGQNQEWVLPALNPPRVQLDNRGFIDLAGSSLRLRAPDDVPPAALYQDSQQFMDLLLKAHTLRRSIGSDSVRVVSLGRAVTESTYTDAWGRTWQIRSWSIPYADALLTVVGLPTPEGYSGLVTTSQMTGHDLAMQLQKILLDYVYVTLEGTVPQWRDYVDGKLPRPKAFGAIKVQVGSDQAVTFRSSRFQLAMPAALLKPGPDSILRLLFAFFHDGSTVTWDVTGLGMGESSTSHNWINVRRHAQPTDNLPEGFQTEWKRLTSNDFPYNSTISTENGETLIGTAVPAAASAVRYSLRALSDGGQTQAVMSQKLDLLRAAFKPLD